MHRIDSATKAPDLFGVGKDGWKDGNKAAGIVATDLTAAFFNDLQENVCGVIEGAGIALSKGDGTQLRQAIAKMIQSGQRTVVIDGVNFAPAVTLTGKAVYWDAANSRFDLAQADGTGKQNCLGFADVPNGNVYAFGKAVLFAGLTPGARYYMDAATPGLITSVAPANAVFVGIARSATELFVDIDVQPPVSTTNVGQLKNLIINGGCLVTQRAAAALSTTPTYGQVDRFVAWATGTVVTAGLIAQDTGSPIGRTGMALKLSGATISGAGVVFARQRIESLNARRLKNQAGSFSVLVYHDVGTPINYQITVRKPNSADNYSGSTIISTGAAVAVATATGTQLKLENVALGDCSNGLEIEVQAACGAVATKNFSFTEWQIEEGAAVSAFEQRDFAIELALCQRYFEKSYSISVAPGAVSNSDRIRYWNSDNQTVGNHPLTFSVRKRTSPTIVIYSPASGTSGKLRDESGSADIGASAGVSSDAGFSVTGAFTTPQTIHSLHFTADAEL